MRYFSNINIAGLSFSLCLAACVLTGCSELDELPDNRTEIDNAEKVAKLMTSAYPTTHYAALCEFCTDNIVDNNVCVKSTHKSAYYDWHDEAFRWKAINNYSVNSDDTPYQVWQDYYAGISVCNHAIEAMQKMTPNPTADKDIAGTWAEAHILRAYLHFILVNIFAESYQDEAHNVANHGIPYVTIAETTVHVDYSTSNFLGNIKETYDRIEKDLLIGLPYITDNYKVRAYHMNKNAAYAFATRFYLYKRDYAKALEYANKVLGESASSMLYKWANVNKNTIDTRMNSYNDETNNNTFLLQSSYSLMWRYISQNARYACNDGTDFTIKDPAGSETKYHVPDAMKTTVWGGGPTWTGSLPAYSSMVFVNGDQDYGGYLFRVFEYFEYTDKIAGIGYVHELFHPFSAEETLLCRAEAKLYLGDKDGAITDLNEWQAARMVEKKLTQSNINSFYGNSRYADYINEMHPAEMGFEKVLTGDELNVLYCVLHYRRMETIHEGDRWFDIKRYGMKITHCYRDPNEDDIHIETLDWNDPRRILQLPQLVIDAGYPPSRPGSSATGGAGSGGYQVATKINGTFTTMK